MIAFAKLPPRVGYVEVERWDGKHVYRNVNTGQIVDDDAFLVAPTTEDRLSALEEAMLAMMGVTPDV